MQAGRLRYDVPLLCQTHKMPDYESIRKRLYVNLKYKFDRCDSEIVRDAISEAIAIVIAERPPPGNHRMPLLSDCGRT